MSEDVAERRAAALESTGPLDSATTADDPAERETVDRVLALLAHPATWATPPDIELPHHEPVAEPEMRPVGDLARRRRLRRPVSWAAAAAAAALVMSLLFWPNNEPTPETIRLDLAGTGQAAAAHASVMAAKLDAGWEFTLTVTDLPGAPQGTYYQGWVIRGDTVVPLGTFHMRKPGDVRLWAGVAVDEFTRMEITLQQVGATAGRGDLVLTGPIPHG
ncbi:anti-sigma factor domain-containing protein [Actinophytocola sp.]|uniref:anti-sigma factor domain-containing protein n=1 Tax=Actinophytocola sp. TaxID=1872138 RepID=UPI002ED07DEE